MGKITFKFENESVTDKVVEGERDLSILNLAEENEIHLNHNCGAVCACSTCHVYIENGEEFLQDSIYRSDRMGIGNL